MARSVFFSFHYERDIWRVSQIRNHFVTKGGYLAAGYIDGAHWETIKKSGSENIKKWIDTQLENTSVTVVLIGTETYSREWVNYEIKRSIEKGNGLLGIYIHDILDNFRSIDRQGLNPLDYWYLNENNNKIVMSKKYKSYYWNRDNGYDNFSKWIEESAKIAGK